eukprot:gb/GFBE01065429.1/.p1 GENE.gb/GFBE01065429.1/~~gb/GFBE01065429.1/.p1  ORF type:complete len:389 (+),score=77.72 gb/GFBE01065429.1/:1-1167(+)
MSSSMIPGRVPTWSKEVPPDEEVELAAMVEASRVTATEMEVFRRCLRRLVQLAAGLGPEWQVRPFGSSASGFGTTGADLDVTCFRPGTQDNVEAIHELRTSFFPMIQSDPSFEIIEAIWSARVPILKLKFEGHVEVDLSCQNQEALLNTELLKAYARLNPVIRDLVMLVKMWTKAQVVSGAPQGHLSSYSWTLMVLYFLQVQTDLQLPCLPTDIFQTGADASVFAHLTWTCKLPLRELLYRFFYFYSSQFHWGSEVVSVRLGRRAQMGDPAFSQLPGQAVWRLHVEDPFLLGRNLNVVLALDKEAELQFKLGSASWAMSHGFLPEGLSNLGGSPARSGNVSADGDRSTSVPSSSKASDSDAEAEFFMPEPPRPEEVPFTRLAAITIIL